jgi:quinol monooxygenase YgiN
MVVPETGDGEVELAVVVGVFDARPGCEGNLGAVLARYVVVSRAQPGCRNIDLVTSLTTPRRFMIYEKWESPDHQRSHMGSPAMSELAGSAAALLAAPPEFGLYEAISAHDLL